MIKTNRINSDNKYAEFLYARGYLIAGNRIKMDWDWEEHIINTCNNIYIYASPDNNVSSASNNDYWVTIIGTVMDTINWHMNSKTIAKKLLSLYQLGEEKMLDFIDYLNGRHIILYGNKYEKYLLQDATGMRTAFYTTNQLMISSHYNLIDDIIQDEKLPFMQKYESYSKRPWTLPGDKTPLKHIKALIPNHKLNLDNMSVSRFWPRNSHDDLTPKKAYDYIADNIRNQMNTLARYHKLCVSLTKGNDSRITLSASKDIKDCITFFSHTTTTETRYKTDTEFAQNISKEHDLNHFCLNLEIPVEKHNDFSQLIDVIDANHYHKYDRTCAYGYLNYFKDKVLHVRSNLIEIIRDFDLFSHITNNTTPSEFAAICSSNYNNDKEAIVMFEDYFREQEYDKIYNYKLCNLLYWEYRMGIWMNAGVLLQDDITFDTYMLFNCRKILEYGLSVPQYFIKNNYVVRECVERLWPQLWNYIPNTDYTAADYILPDYNNHFQLTDGYITSGTLSGNVTPKIYAKIGRYNGILGFGSTIVLKDQYIDYNLDLPVYNDIYVLQISLMFNTQNQITKNFASYEIFIGDKKCYSSGVTRFQNKINQVCIIHNFKNDKSKKLCIRLLAHADYYAENGAAGLFTICSITYSLQGNYQGVDETRVISTVEMLAELTKDIIQ